MRNFGQEQECIHTSFITFTISESPPTFSHPLPSSAENLLRSRIAIGQKSIMAFKKSSSTSFGFPWPKLALEDPRKRWVAACTALSTKIPCNQEYIRHDKIQNISIKKPSSTQVYNSTGLPDLCNPTQEKVKQNGNMLLLSFMHQVIHPKFKLSRKYGQYTHTLTLPLMFWLHQAYEVYSKW